MIIGGLDASMNSSGMWLIEVDENFKIKRQDFAGFTDVIKTSKLSNKLFFFNDDWFENRYQKTHWMKDKIVGFLSACDFIALEGAAFGAKGKLHDIGEFTGIIKFFLLLYGSKIRIYEPNVVKQFATGKGNAKKDGMFESFKGLDEMVLLKDLPSAENKEKGVSPTSDVIDSFWMARCLMKELQLRLDSSIELSEQERRVFGVDEKKSKKKSKAKEKVKMTEKPFLCLRT